MKHSKYFKIIEEILLEIEREEQNIPKIDFSLKKQIKSVIMNRSKGRENPKQIEDDIMKVYWNLFG